MLSPADSLNIQIDDLRLSIVFVSTSGEPNVKSLALNDRHLQLELENFSNALGTTWRSPIGSLFDRPLHMGITVHLIGEKKAGSRVVQYCLLLGPPDG
jgi:hypothetical protein